MLIKPWAPFSRTKITYNCRHQYFSLTLSNYRDRIIHNFLFGFRDSFACNIIKLTNYKCKYTLISSKVMDFSIICCPKLCLIKVTPLMNPHTQSSYSPHRLLSELAFICTYNLPPPPLQPNVHQRK